MTTPRSTPPAHSPHSAASGGERLDPKALAQRRREALRRRTRRILASEGVFDSIVSLAGILGRPVTNQTGQEIGRLEDHTRPLAEEVAILRKDLDDRTLERNET